MAMTVEQWNALTRDIIAKHEDLGEVTALLNQANMEFSELFAQATKSAEDVAALTQDKENLQKQNLAFFLQLGDQRAAENRQKEQNQDKDVSRAETIKPEDLFKKED